MKKPMMCIYCDKTYPPVKKKFSWGLFLLFFGVFYLIYRAFLPKNRCPICGSIMV